MKYNYFSISHKKSKYIIGDIVDDQSKTYTNKYLVNEFDEADPVKTIEDCIYYFISREVMPTQPSLVMGSSILYVVNRVNECKKSNKFVITIPPEYHEFDRKVGLFDLDVTIEIDDGTVNTDEYVII